MFLLAPPGSVRKASSTPVVDTFFNFSAFVYLTSTYRRLPAATGSSGHPDGVGNVQRSGVLGWQCSLGPRTPKEVDDKVCRVFIGLGHYPPSSFYSMRLVHTPTPVQTPPHRYCYPDVARRDPS